MNRKEKREIGLCYDCHEPADKNKTRCTKHRRSNIAIVEKYRKTDKGKKSAERMKNWLAIWRRKYRRTKGRFTYIKSHSLRRGKTWSLSKEEYNSIISLPCFYCGLENDVVAGVGIDRLNNKFGYIADNVVSCCSMCNYTRGNRFTTDEMKLIGIIIKRIKLNRKNKI